MLNTRLDAKILASDLAERSVCNVKVGAVLSDNRGIFAWGWNSPGQDCRGWHAEHHCISRANRRRLVGSFLTVAAFRKDKMISARPCEKCMPLVKKYGIKIVKYTTKDGWETEYF